MDENPNYGADTPDHVAYIRVSGPPFVAPYFDDSGEQRGFLRCFKPPWARLLAVDVQSGEIAWEVPLGLEERLPEGKQRVGSHGVGGPMVTAGGLTFIGATGTDGSGRSTPAPATSCGPSRSTTTSRRCR